MLDAARLHLPALYSQMDCQDCCLSCSLNAWQGSLYLTNSQTEALRLNCSPDGEQVTVDFDGGLDKIPKAQREEVTELYHSHMDGLAKFASAFGKKGSTRR